MIPQELIHQRWVALTDGGKLDSRVHDARRDIEILRTSLRARFNINAEALAHLEAFERAVVDQLERDIVCSAYGPRFTEADYP
jgi:hypothetical protein